MNFKNVRATQNRFLELFPRPHAARLLFPPSHFPHKISLVAKNPLKGYIVPDDEGTQGAVRSFFFFLRFVRCVMAGGIKIVAENRRARADYAIDETYEAGLVLTGTEVKALREGRANLKESYGDIIGGEAWLVDCHISPYGHGNIHNHEPTRRRKLLLHKREIGRLIGRVNERGMTLVPMKMYFARGRAKVEIGVGKGKKFHDRREELKKRAANREIERALRERNR